jgi:hypothetical protein
MIVGSEALLKALPHGNRCLKCRSCGLKDAEHFVSLLEAKIQRSIRHCFANLLLEASDQLPGRSIAVLHGVGRITADVGDQDGTQR